IANYWKKWIGETQGLKQSNAIAIKRNQEASFMQKVNKAGKQAEYGNLLRDFETNYKAIAPYSLSRDYFSEVILTNSELLKLGFRLYQLEQAFIQRGEQSFTDRKNNLLAGMESFYANYNNDVDRDVFGKIVALYAKNSPQQFVPAGLKNADLQKLTDEIYTNSKLTNIEGIRNLLSGDAATVLKNMNNDPAFKFVKEATDMYFDNVADKYEELNLNISALQRTYMKALLELEKDAR